MKMPSNTKIGPEKGSYATLKKFSNCQGSKAQNAFTNVKTSTPAIDYLRN